MNQIEKFKEYFYYLDGEIYWKKTSGSRGVKDHKAGKQRKDGYFDVGLCGKYYLVHRIIFALVNGYLPEYVDHIDRNPSNNHPENLREATTNENAHNSGVSINNKLKVKGIRLTKYGRYEARVAVENKTKQVGTYPTLEEAKEALVAFRSKLHGEYTCHG